MAELAVPTLAVPHLIAPVSTRHLQPHNSFTAFPPEALAQSLAERFEQQVHRHAERLAVKSRHESLTYAELNQRANRVAYTIATHDASPTDPVALLFAQGTPAIVAILGVWKAGRPLVLLD